MPITIGTHPINSLLERTPNGSGYWPPTSVVTIQPSAPQIDDDMPNCGDKSGPAPPYPADGKYYIEIKIENFPTLLKFRFITFFVIPDPPSYTTAIIIESVPT